MLSQLAPLSHCHSPCPSYSARSNNRAGDKRQLLPLLQFRAACISSFEAATKGATRRGQRQSTSEGGGGYDRHRKKRRSLSALLEPKRNFASFRVIGQNHSEWQRKRSAIPAKSSSNKGRRRRAG